MTVKIPDQFEPLIEEIDEFIDREIIPLEEKHPEFFDYRREHSRTDWDNGGVPAEEWEEFVAEQRRRADEAGLYRYPLPTSVGGRDGSHFGLAIIREYLAKRGVGLHNVLQQEASIVGDFPFVNLLFEFGTEEQQELIDPLITRDTEMAFGLTEPEHGSDATWMNSTAVRDGDEWIINGVKRWNSNMYNADYDLVFARTSGKDGDHDGITAFLVPTDSTGLEIERYWWTFNMPTDHAEVNLNDVRVPDSAIFGKEGQALAIAQHVFHDSSRIRQAASSLGAAQFCINESVEYAKSRTTWGKPIAHRQAIQFPLAELHTEAELVRAHVRETAKLLDNENQLDISDKVSMANYRANDLACRAADRAMQVHGGIGYSRAKPFEHIYRHHRRYRITEGAEEIQKRRIAGHLFGFID
jgi:alkylation response protein AidB-like acyl-CoA dehydrogenase